MANVSAPYNFVPLNKKVFFPPWADLVNHDVPFENGLSGKIELEITAETPIFIRGKEEVNDEDNRYKQYRFPKKEDRYYIPGSSIRNMLRSVVEIMSFSKLNIINDYKKIGFRDMANPDLYDIRTNISDNLKFGWLFKKDNKIHIEDLGILGDLRNEQNNTINVYRDNRFSNLRRFYNRNLENKPTLTQKYSRFNTHNPNETATNYSENLEKVIVLTGYISGKTHEFIFNRPTFLENLEISKSKFKDFLLANPINDDYNNGWGFWKSRFNEGNAIPIFFRTDDNDNILDFGLTVLYRMTHKNSVLDLLKKNQPNYDDARLDLTESIFGKADNEFKLKGRVIVNHAFSSNGEEFEKQNLVLGEPNHSFYPNYIKQNTQNNGTLIGNFNTLSNELAELNGRKRYPIHNRKPFDPSDINQEEPESRKVITSFYPLKDGTTFKTKLIYHNILPTELGAIISAITFHNSEKHRHNIGFAKPYGFGKVNLSITNMDKDEQVKYMGIFEKSISEYLKREEIDWLNSKQLKELFAMSSAEVIQDRDKLKYMKLADFQKIKKVNKESKRDAKIRLNKERVRNDELLVYNVKQALPPYTKFMNVGSFNINTCIDDNTKSDIENWEITKEIRQNTSNIKDIKNHINEINTKLKKLKKRSNKIQELASNLQNIIFENLDQDYKTYTYKAIVYSLNPKLATLLIDNTKTEIQLIIPKGFDIRNISIGSEINVQIHQISTKKQKIVSVKIIDN